MKKKILFVAPLPPPVHGGALRNQSVANSQLINKVFNLQVVSVNQASDIHDIGKFSWKKVGKTLRHTQKILSQLIGFKPDLVYFNISLYGFALYRDTLYVTLFKLFGRKIIYHLRTQGVQAQVRKNIFLKALFKYIFNATEVICLSKALVRDIEGVYKGTPFIVNNGIEIINFTSNTTISINHTTTLLFLSNFNKKKGIEDFLLALEQLHKRQQNFNAILVGKEDDYTISDLKEEIEHLNLCDKVTVVGPLYGDKKYQILSQSDVFVLPTYFEAFPGVILEAMQFGLPVISTLEGAIPEIVDHGKTGFLVEKRNIHELANAMEQLIINENLRTKMGLNGKEKFFQYYTLDKFENQLVSVFNIVLSKKWL